MKLLLAALALAFLVGMWAVILKLVRQSMDVDVGGWFWAGPPTLSAGAVVLLAAFGVGEARAVLHDDWQAICGILGVIIVPLLGYRGWRGQQVSNVQVAQAAVQVAQVEKAADVQVAQVKAGVIP